VVVVTHQAVAVADPACLVDGRFDEIEEEPPVGLGAIDRPALVPARSDVIQRARVLDAELT
jgi:hypothetical protein